MATTRPLARPLLALALLATLAGCATTATTPVATTPPPAPVAATVPANDNLNAVLWLQDSVEYRLIAGQTWQGALAQLDKAIKSPDWDALPQGERTVPARGLPPAVIVDVDETVLDNSPFQARLVAHDAAYDEADWRRWVEERAADPVPGALPFLREAAARGVTVFYITNRTADLADPTRAKQRLVLSHCAEAKRWGNVEHLLPSRFLDELPPGDIRRDGGDPEAESAEKKQRGRAHLADIAALFD
jgi:acid phosphatase